MNTFTEEGGIIGGMARVKRETRFELRLSDKEAEMLELLADADGTSGADLLRRLMREEWKKRLRKDNRC